MVQRVNIMTEECLYIKNLQDFRHVRHTCALNKGCGENPLPALQATAAPPTINVPADQNAISLPKGQIFRIPSKVVQSHHPFGTSLRT